MTKPSYEEAELKKLAEKARDFVPEPIKCLHCDKVMSQSTGPMASGGIWMDRCNDGQSGHTYSFSLGPIDNPATQFAAAANPQTILELLASLARVRGLLQRGIECARIVVEAETMRYVGTPLTVDDHISELDEWIAEANPVAQGAESADMGKVDSADKSGVDENAELKELLRRGYHLFNVEGTDFAESEEVGEKWMEEVEVALAGSAETGGEKAAPQNDEKLREIVWNAQTAELIRQGKAGHNVDCVDGYDLCDAIVNALATFRRTSQNQTVSSGVEGAHEGTTADKSELLPTQLPKEK